MEKEIKIQGFYFIKYMLPLPITGETTSIIELKVFDGECIFQKIREAIVNEKPTINMLEILITHISKL